jgi:hypothetical protein
MHEVSAAPRGRQGLHDPESPVRSFFAVALLAGSSFAARCERSPTPASPTAASSEARSFPDASPASAPVDRGASSTTTASAPADAPDASPAPTGYCEDHKTLSVDLGGVGGQPLDRVTWRRCTGEDPDYPTDRLLLAMHGIANPVVLYTNAGDELAEGLRFVKPVQLTDKGNQLLWVEQMYGTGNIHNWKVADWRHGKLRTWIEPDEFPACEKLRKKGEEPIGHEYGEGPVVHGRTLVLGYVIYKVGECNACASGGIAKVELLARDGAFELVRAWRQAEP